MRHATSLSHTEWAGCSTANKDTRILGYASCLHAPEPCYPMRPSLMKNLLLVPCNPRGEHSRQYEAPSVLGGIILRTERHQGIVLQLSKVRCPTVKGTTPAVSAHHAPATSPVCSIGGSMNIQATIYTADG